VIRVNGDDATYVRQSVAELLASRGIEVRGVAVALNGEVVSRSLWSSTMIEDGAAVEIVTAVAGG